MCKEVKEMEQPSQIFFLSNEKISNICPNQYSPKEEEAKGLQQA